MTIPKISAIGCLLLMTTACGTFNSVTEKTTLRSINKHNVTEDAILTSVGTEQLTYIKRHKSLIRFCSETNTDADTTKNFGVGLAEFGQSVSIGDGNSTLGLGGRNPEVLITRELMFRTCELTLNANLDAENSVKLYLRTLTTLKELFKNYKGGSGTKGSGIESKVPVENLGIGSGGNGNKALEGDKAATHDFNNANVNFDYDGNKIDNNHD